MGQVIYLNERRGERLPATPQQPPAFFFDISCPLSYLTAERVERRLGEVEWIPVDGASMSCGSGGEWTEPALAPAARSPERALADGAEHSAHHAVRVRADACARALRLPLVWPDRFPGEARCAQRAATFACEIGAGAAFALAASRLAFCGGFDLEDPETLAEAAAAAGVPLDECLKAAGEAWRDEELEYAAAVLRAHGVTELPAIRVGDRWFGGEAGLTAASARLSESAAPGRRLAPVR
jgi:2-hydroxychromene-2-carboxylate isomerase